MTTPARRTQAPVPDGRRLTGHPDAVAARVEEMRRSPTYQGLVIEQNPRRKDLDGTVVVDVQFIRPASPVARVARVVNVPPPRRRRGARFWGIVAAVVSAAVAVVVSAVVALVQALIDAADKAAHGFSDLAGVVLPSLLGLIVVLAALGVMAAAGGRGGFSGTFKGSMD